MLKKRNCDITIDKENQVCTWDDGTIKIKYSNPRIEVSGQKRHIKSIQEAMYYYYDFSVYRRKIIFLENGVKKDLWEEVFSICAYDFPGIEGFLWALDELLGQGKPTEDYQTDKWGDGDIVKKYTIDISDSAFSEDIYSITKIFFPKEYRKRVGYRIQFGTSNPTAPYSQFIKTALLSHYNVVKLRECVKAFIDISVRAYNKSMIKLYAKERTNKKIIDKVLVVRDDFENMDTFYVENDTIHTLQFVTNPRNNAIETSNLKIEKIDPDKITFVNSNDEKIVIKLENIYDIYSYDGENKLNFDKEEIVDDFINTILTQSQTIKDDFINLSIETLYDKYYMGIIDRSWMCREEHPYMPKDPNGQNYEIAKKIVKEDIIPKIKEKITT